MKDTPNSKTDSNNIIGKLRIVAGEDSRNLPNSLINKCPATIFAESRTDRVIGRIEFLIISIITIKFISWVGVPVGTICAIIVEKFLAHPNNMKANHILKARVNEKDKWAVGVKSKGVKAIMLINKIIENNLNRINLESFVWFGYIKEFNSLKKKVDRFIIKTERFESKRDLNKQNIIKMGIKDVNQARL